MTTLHLMLALAISGSALPHPFEMWAVVVSGSMVHLRVEGTIAVAALLSLTDQKKTVAVDSESDL